MILVTGASGFLGQHLLQLLSSGQETIVALYHSNRPDLSYKGVVWKRCDLLDLTAVQEAMAGVRKVYHCAAIVSFDPKDGGRLIEHNITATQHIVNASLEQGVERLVHVSSIASLGRWNANGRGHLIDEETHWEDAKDASNYAKGKFLSEMEVWRGMAEGLNAVIVNPGIILGAGDWDKGSAKLMKIVAGGFPWYTNGVNGWVDVRDVAQALLLLMESDIREQRFILSAGNFSYLEIFTEMARQLGIPPPHKLATPFLSALVWRWSLLKSRWTGQQATLTKESARTAQSRFLFDNSKFLNAFPEFRYRDMEDTIVAMAQAYRGKTLS